MFDWMTNSLYWLMNSFLGFVSLVLIGAFVLAFTVCMPIAWATCSAQWSHSGYDYSFGPIKGCIVRVNGKWIPAENVREVGR